MAFSPDIAPEITTFEPSIGQGADSSFWHVAGTSTSPLTDAVMALRRSVPMATLWMFCLKRRDLRVWVLRGERIWLFRRHHRGC